MEIPRPEYPRPQLVRDQMAQPQWPLGFRVRPRSERRCPRPASGREAGARDPGALLPGKRSLGIQETDFHPGVWYRREFHVPEEWAGQRVLLHVGAVDHDACVWVNGQQAGTHRGGYTSFALDVTDLLVRGENVLVVHAQDDTRSPLVPSGKQCPEYHSLACFYTRTTGIWQTVWLEPVPQTYIGHLRLTPDLENGRVIIEVEVAGRPARGTLQARASLAGQAVGEAQAHFAGQRAVVVLGVHEVQAWAPGQPTLYDLQLTLSTEDGSRDVVQSYFGLRSLALSDQAHPAQRPAGLPAAGARPGLLPRRHLHRPLRRGPAQRHRALAGDGLQRRAPAPEGVRAALPLLGRPAGLPGVGRVPQLGPGSERPPRRWRFSLPQWLEALRRDYSHPALVGWCPFNETQPDQDPRGAAQRLPRHQGRRPDPPGDRHQRLPARRDRHL